MQVRSIVEIVLVLGAVQGLLLAVLIPRLSKINANANRYLSALISAVSFSLILFLAISIYEVVSLRMIVFIDTLAFLFAPLIYLYIRKLLYPEVVWNKRYALHFLPAILHFLYGLSIFRFSNETMTSLVSTNAFRLEWLIIFSILVVSTFAYWAVSLQLVLAFRRKAKKVISYKPKITYLSTFLFFLFLGNSISMVFAMDFFFEIQFVTYTKTYIGWTLIPFLVYTLTYFAIRQPETIKLPYYTTAVASQRMNNAEIKRNKDLLEWCMEDKKPYLNPTLSLSELAQLLQISPTKLSWLLNHCYQTNFYDFINSYRLADFVVKLKNKEYQQNTLLSLAYDVGFNSKTTFNKAFKKIFNNTPSEYIKGLQIP